MPGWKKQPLSHDGFIVDPAELFKRVHNALASLICRHAVVPCTYCKKLMKPLVKPFGRALLAAAGGNMSEDSKYFSPRTLEFAGRGLMMLLDDGDRSLKHKLYNREKRNGKQEEAKAET